MLTVVSLVVLCMARIALHHHEAVFVSIRVAVRSNIALL